MHLLPPIQIPHSAPCAHPPPPHSTNNETNPPPQEPVANQKISQSQITIKQLIVSRQVSPTPTHTNTNG